MESDEPLSRFPPTLAGALLDTVAAVVVADPDQRVTHWSRGAQALWSYGPDEVIGRPLTDLITPEGRIRRSDGRVLDGKAELVPLGEAGCLMLAMPGSTMNGSVEDTLKRWMFDQHPLGLAIYDRDARWLVGNETIRQWMALSEDETRGRHVSEIFPGTGPHEEDTWMHRALQTGKPESYERVYRHATDARTHAWVVDIFPIKDTEGRVQAVGASAYDAHQQYESRERLALLSEARTRIGTSLDVAGTARELAEVAAPRFADVVIVDLLDAVFRGEMPVVPVGAVPLRRAALRAAAPICWEYSAVGAISSHAVSSPIARCMATGRAELHRVTDPAVVDWFAEDPDLAAEARACGMDSLIAVPIRARGITLGTALFIRCAASREPFYPDDLTVTEDLVARAAICLDNARRYARERGIALALQRSLLPRGPIRHQAAETAVRYLPAGGRAEAGGDWYDVIPLPGARVGLVVGDVVGHGITASATMGRLRMAVRTLADIDLPPDELLTHLDDIITHADDRQSTSTISEIPGDIGASCLYAVYDPLSGTCSMARAGHPAPVLVHPDGTSEVVDLPAGPPLGLGSLPFVATEVAMPEGSLLALFTDGLLTAGGRDIDDGLDAVRRALAQPETSIEALCDTVLDTLCPEPRTDDIALLLARAQVFHEDRVASWDIPADHAVVADTRRRARDRLAAWGMEEAAFVTELVVSELVTNAIRYGSGPIRLRLIKDETLICEVSDGSSTSPHLRRAGLSDEGGRGLFMVAELTQRWGTRYSTTGKTIWAEQNLPQD